MKIIKKSMTMFLIIITVTCTLQSKKSPPPTVALFDNATGEFYPLLDDLFDKILVDYQALCFASNLLQEGNLLFIETFMEKAHEKKLVQLFETPISYWSWILSSVVWNKSLSVVVSVFKEANHSDIFMPELYWNFILHEASRNKNKEIFAYVKDLHKKIFPFSSSSRVHSTNPPTSPSANPLGHPLLPSTDLERSSSLPPKECCCIIS